MSAGLYTAGEFKDNCGFGLIAHMHGESSHRLLSTAIEALTCMTHRGGIAADGKTGDGCGLLIQSPTSFLRSVAEQDLQVTLSNHFAVGQIFLSKNTDLAAAARAEFAKQVEAQGLKVVGWRKVPVDPSVCGEIALETLPEIEQLFIDAPDVDPADLSAKLFVVRRLTEKALESDQDFYICSLSERVLSYKGLVMPVDLPRFYLDLADERLETAICVFHQRFSTNTSPRWPLAQPFRLLAHNGEINTIDGNRNWADARSSKFVCEKLPNIKELMPLVNRTGSDSSSMDNMLDVLLTGGMDLFRALRMMIPPAWQNIESMDSDLRAFYEYNSMHLEPWDGPAGLVLTEGRHAVCMLDRNGLRPARYVITKDGFITLASEIGVYDYSPEDVVSKGRIGPGQMLVVDTHTGELLLTDDIDQRLKSSKPYRKWLRQNTVVIEGHLDSDEPVNQITGDDLDVFMKMFKVSFEEAEQVLRPLGETGQEAVGSMGDDTPMAVLSSQQRSLYDYFRQKFAQVTNPPIDPLREAIVMSLETCMGPELNVYEETAEHANRVVLSSPVLSDSKFQALTNLESRGYPSLPLSLQYNPEEKTLEQAVKDIADAAETAVKAGTVFVVLTDRDIQKGMLPVHALLATGAVS